jgi:hypothetical protein
MHQLVLGIAGPSFLDVVFSQADTVPRAKLAEWFDHQTGQMGGEDSVRVVQDLIGHAQHFDFAQVSERVPKLDLPDLAPFFRLALRNNRRQLTDTGGFLAFKTPDSWLRSVGIRPRYNDVQFCRKALTGEKCTILGVGSRLFDIALEQACALPDSYAAVTDRPESGLLLVFRCYDRITGNLGQPKSIICGVLREADSFRTLKDWEVLLLLNELAGTVKATAESEAEPTAAPAGNIEMLTEAEALMRETLPSMDLPFRQPELELLGIIAGIRETTIALFRGQSPEHCDRRAGRPKPPISALDRK